MAKFKKKAFRTWLDVLTKVVVKARDDYTCQRCGKKLIPGDNNTQWCHIKSRKSNQWRWDLNDAITMCGSCHATTTDNPDEFGIWFKEKWPARHEHINTPYKPRTWKEQDYKDVEAYLLEKAIELEVDFMHVPTSSGYRARFCRRIKEFQDRKEGNL